MKTNLRQATTIADVNREIKKVNKSISDIPIYQGFGSPENVVVADMGSMYLNMDGGTSTTLYIKESGNGVSSGWIAK